MKYKRLFEQRITSYNGQWYCYLCKIELQDLMEAQRHSKDAHSSISTHCQIYDSLNKFINLSNKKSKKLLSHGLVIRDGQQDLLCLYCQSSVLLCDFSQHLEEENHQKCINAIVKRSTSEQRSSSEYTNDEEENASVTAENPMGHINESNFSTNIQPICENELTKDSSNNSIPMANDNCTNEEQENASVDAENPTGHINESNFSTNIQPICENELTKDSSNNSIPMANGNCTNDEQENASVDAENPTGHINESNISTEMQPIYENKLTKDSSNNSIPMANDNCTNEEQENASVDAENPTGHINESNISTEMQPIYENKLTKDFSNNSMSMENGTIASVPYALLQEGKMREHFLMQHRIHYSQWCCHLCKSILHTLRDVDCHMQEAHPDSGTKLLDFLAKSVKLGDTNSRTLSNHEIAMRDMPQEEHFCTSCQCPLLSSDKFYEHLTGNRHKCIQCNEKFINSNIVLETESPADKRQNVNNDTIENQNVSIDAPGENDLIGNLPSNSRAEEKSTVSFKSRNEGSDILLAMRYLDEAFCCLCDRFFYKTFIKNHMTEKEHKHAANISKNPARQASCVIKLGEKRKTLKPLQLNSKNFDGTIWPEYTKTEAKYTCDQCNKIIEDSDIINHEITVHRSGMMFSVRSILDWLRTKGTIKDLNVFMYYPLFRCSFCNEIIHGVMSLKVHFSKCDHKENIKLLFDMKRQEYDSCKDIQIYLEPLELLTLISFENNDGNIRIQEQPVIYIKIRCITFCEKRINRKKFIYVCFTCKNNFFDIHYVINHLCSTLTHLKDFQSILPTYKYIYNVAVSREPNVNESEHEVTSPVSKNLSIDNGLLEKRDIDETQVNRRQHRNHNVIADVKNASSKNDRLCENKENNFGFFISFNIFTQLNSSIKNDCVSLTETARSHAVSKNSAVDRYNKMYEKQFLDFEEIMFACNERKLKDITSNLQFFLPLPFPSNKMLCLVCNDTTNTTDCNAQAIYQHINSMKHLLQFKKLLQNKEHFELLKELMKIKPANFLYIKCFVCNITISGTCNEQFNMDCKKHINQPFHKKHRKQLLNRAENILAEFENLWYSIQYFACADCNKRFKMKIRFMEHLNNTHKTVLVDKDDGNSMFDFCLTCATLWYKNESQASLIRINYQIHCQQPTHQFLEKSNDFVVTSLPKSLQEFLKNVNETGDYLFKSSNDILNDPKVTEFMDALNHTLKKLPVKVYMFGSRVTGLALTNSDIDIFLNFGDNCTEQELSVSRIKQIQDCLRTERENWDIELTLFRSRTPIIKVRHRLTALQCDISFMNGLSVENSNLIRSFNIAYPPCKKLILLLKRWLSLGGLTGKDGITSYALVWLVIFYLQVKYKIPSIAALIKSHNKSKIVSGWETGVSDNISINVPEIPVNELLSGFFEYYGNFDYMHCVICPLLGKTCRKKAFVEISTLPKSMTLYIAQLQNEKPEYFRIDSSMCVQDPFDLSHNLTKAVPILTLKRFKHYCTESLSALRDTTLTLVRKKKPKKLS